MSHHAPFQTVTRLAFVFLGVSLVLSPPVSAQPGNPDATAPVLQQMTGTWDVQQRMWSDPDAASAELPPAVARRRLVDGGGYIEEIMTPASPSADGTFTRSAHFNYNPVTRRFEYFSIDSRAPQQMHYQSAPREPDAAGLVRLEGGLFVAAQWGDQRHLAFSYRIELRAVESGRQVLRLYLTPLAGEGSREFLAFEYVYVRRT